MDKRFAAKPTLRIKSGLMNPSVDLTVRRTVPFNLKQKKCEIVVRNNNVIIFYGAVSNAQQYHSSHPTSFSFRHRIGQVSHHLTELAS